MIDICTVVFADELDTLKLQARSIELYCKNIGLQNIWVMINDDSTVDPAWFGIMAPMVQIVPRQEFRSEWSSNGWVSQQVLKMLGSARSQNTWCMILDAKTFFIKPVRLDEIFVDGRAATGTLPIYPVFETSKRITDQLFDINLPAQLGPGGVPFLVRPELVRDMILEIEHRTGQAFTDYFQQQGMLTEFILYSGYVWYHCGNFDQYYYSTPTIRPCNICHSEVGRVDALLTTMTDPDILTVSIHRHAWQQLSQEQQQKYHKLLQQKGIL